MIMIVDDSPQMRTVIRRFLQKMNADREYHECDDGHEAVEAYERLRPEWVLMDVKMQGMDGLLATESILQKYPKAKIVIVTNFDEPELRAAAQRAGAHGYVTKDRLWELRNLISWMES